MGYCLLKNNLVEETTDDARTCTYDNPSVQFVQ